MVMVCDTFLTGLAMGQGREDDWGDISQPNRVTLLPTQNSTPSSVRARAVVVKSFPYGDDRSMNR